MNSSFFVSSINATGKHGENSAVYHNKFKFEKQKSKIYKMNIISFKESIAEKEPPQHISVYLKALWYDAKSDWDKAHKLIQDVDDKNASWIHAYLHRKEGDTSNADYWYSRAGKRRPSFSLGNEWEEIVSAFL